MTDTPAPVAQPLSAEVLCGAAMLVCRNEPDHPGDHWNPAVSGVADVPQRGPVGDVPGQGAVTAGFRRYTPTEFGTMADDPNGQWVHESDATRSVPDNAAHCEGCAGDVMAGSPRVRQPCRGCSVPDNAAPLAECERCGDLTLHGGLPEREVPDNAAPCSDPITCEHLYHDAAGVPLGAVPDNAALREAAEWHLANPHNVNEGHSRLRAALAAAPASPAGLDDLVRAAQAMVDRYDEAPYEVFDEEIDRLRRRLAALASPGEASPEPYTAGKGMSEYDRLSHKGAVDERDF